jgi:hypothetical protein
MPLASLIPELRLTDVPTQSPSPQLAASVRLRELEKANEELRDQRLCCVCLDAERCIAVVGCGHINTCANCHDALPEPKRCVSCCAPISSAIRVWLLRVG